MPRERRDRSLSCDRIWSSAYSSSSSHGKQSMTGSPAETEENVKEWEEARCPVCMEHPHNAVLLICSSHEKGCRPYMCNTSYRHSNCLDQFCKSFDENSPSIPQEGNQQSTEMDLSSIEAAATIGDDIQERSEGSVTLPRLTCENQAEPRLVCPLCRGQVKEWRIVEAARKFMNEKSRSCSCEACNFSGTYTDLRKHARVEHPSVRPSEADPERVRKWRRLERQRDLGDLISTLQSSFVEDRVDDAMVATEEESGGGWLTILLIRILQPGPSTTSGGSWPGASRARVRMSIRRRSTRHWGEGFDGETGSSSRDDDNESSDGGSGPWRRRVRRRTSPDEES